MVSLLLESGADTGIVRGERGRGTGRGWEAVAELTPGAWAKVSEKI